MFTRTKYLEQESRSSNIKIVVERELNVPLPLSKIIKKWNNLLQEYKAIKLSEEPKRREWPFFNLMDVYFSDQVNDPTLRLFSSTKTLGSDSFYYNIKLEDDPVMASAAASAGSLMDISDMMQDAQSDKASENNFDDSKSDAPVNSSSDTNNTHNNYNDVNRHRDYEEKIESLKPQSHTPSFMPPHHNIDQYLLSWNNFHGNMCKGFHNLQKDEKMVDVTIAAGGKIFKAHKLVLSVCSPYFQKIFLEHPSNHPILFMADVNSGHMAGLLDFMYSGQVNVKYEDLPKFLKVAESMQIKGLHTESTTEIDDPKV
ncbi:Longitudinals lacking protein-like [Pseudolycoriella hygida]|uniref:Longitudinals lacking protein-like n=1 Tax=Pseudolycoriella hygida TaxID=35572 RepID=A0A9Q0RZL8_9DIPT|nr:Longitudinals lacking protein-like [Pseudolycoriella hygida]